MHRPYTHIPANLLAERQQMEHFALIFFRIIAALFCCDINAQTSNIAPTPALIELHPPFPPTYGAIYEVEPGVIAVTNDGNIGIFNGLTWRRIHCLHIAPQSLLRRGNLLWAGGSGQIGYVDLSSNDDVYHLISSDLHDNITFLQNVGASVLAISNSAARLFSPNGRTLDIFRFNRSTVRHAIPWRDGWLLLSAIDPVFLRISKEHFYSEDLPIPRRVLTDSAIVGATRTSNGTIFTGVKQSFEWREGKLIPLNSPAWIGRENDRAVISLQWISESTILRFSLNSGIEGLSEDGQTIKWRISPGTRPIGTLNAPPIIAQQGVLFVTDSHVFWIPPTSSVRNLTGSRKERGIVTSAHNGWWISTDEGSWQIAPNSWDVSDFNPTRSWTVYETAGYTIRGQISKFEVNSKIIATDHSRGLVTYISSNHTGVAMAQDSEVTFWNKSWINTAIIDLPSPCTSIAPDNEGFSIATYRNGVFHWKPGDPLDPISQRGKMLSVVCNAGSTRVILWSDGWLQIGSKTLTVKTPAAGGWYGLAASENTIVLGGQDGDSATLMLLNKSRDGIWNTYPLDHPILDDLSEADWLSLYGDNIAITAPNETIEMALPPNTPIPEIPLPAINTASTGKSAGKITVFPSTSARDHILRLGPDDNELKFDLRGGPAYWNFRAKVSYRITPDSREWSEIDKGKEIRIERISAGTHVLELLQHSPLGDRISRYTIIRPPYWYASHWAFGAYGLSLMGATAGFFVWRTRRLRVRARVLEERVAQRTAELKKANEAKDEFLASMSHEIRNPLNGVIGLSGMLQESVQTERDRRLIESLRACADQLRLVLDDVLDFSVIERGDVQLQLAPFNPAAAIRAAVVAVDAKLERTRVTLGPKLADGLWLRGDEGKLRQIVSNLVSNAHKYGVPPEAKVDARLHDGRLIVTVSNTGPDIPPDDQARIFESFERGRSAAHKYVRGAGLGLTISSRFARAMGGEITVKSENGLTSFAASIPAPVVEKPAHTMAASAAPSRGVALAIEDEPYNRLVLGHVLSGLGFEVEWAQNGTDALDILKSGRPYAMIFTDWMLPDMQGGELVRQIKQLRGEATPPMVAVTAYATAEKRAEAFDAGVAAFVTKPITPEKIEGAVQANAAADAPFPPVAQDEPLRVGILLDGNDAAERVASFRTELLQHMAEIETALRQHDSDRTARTAHRLASQLLAIHHHTFADELRALETAALRYQWDLVRDLYANATRAATSLSRQLETLANSHSAKPASDRP